MVKKLLTLFALFFFAVQVFSQTFSFMHGGISRSYIVHLPTGYSNVNQYPLVINMHGLTSTASQQQLYTQMDAVADTGHFIVVYPDGVNNSWNAGFGGNSVDDVGFLSALIDTMKANYSVNAAKVYSCGLSNGGFMSFRLACELQNKIAAIAPVAGLMTNSVRLFCQSACPVPVMYFHGTADGVVNYNGTLGFVGADSTIKIWVGKDGCPATPVVTNMPDINPVDGCTATRYVYSLGQNSSEVIFFKITGGGHTWPGGFPVTSLGNTCLDIKASGEIWKFFKKFSLQCAGSGVSEENAVEEIKIFPNPTSGRFEIPGTVLSAEVYNSFGQLIYEDVFAGVKPVVDITSYPNGIYFLKINTKLGISYSKILKD